MKKLLLVINCVLGLLVLIVLISNLASLRKSGETFEVKKRTSKRGQNQETTKRTTLVIPEDKQIETIVNSDIFNPERTPNVSAWGRGRAQITLVGTFKVGKMEGAIILQQGVNRGMLPNRMGAMMSQDAMMQMMRQGAGNQQNNGMGMGGGRQNNRMGMGGNQRMGSMRQRWSMLNPQLARQLAGDNQQTPIKQYVRVGETLANGYTLTEVSRTKAILTKNGDKMELDLQDPSKNMAKGGTGRRQGNSWRQFQETQIRTQQQMLRMMYMMQSRMGSGGGGGGRGGRR